MNPARKREYAAALASVLLLYGLALLLFHSLAGGTLLKINPYDSYSLQAQNWLAGRNYIANGENYSWLELAIYNGKYYQSFPPMPAVLLLPWVLAFGTAPSNLAVALYGLLTAVGVFGCFWRRSAAPRTAAFWAFFYCIGSGFFWLSSNGGVWFMAQVCGGMLAVWGVFYLCGGQNTAGCLCLALAVGCRPFYALLLGAVWVRLAWQTAHSRKWSALIGPTLAAGAVALGLMAYNFARFGSPLEFGHNYLPEFVRAEHGQFGLFYFMENLRCLFRPVTLDSAANLVFSTSNGFLFFLANPMFLLWPVLAVGGLWQRRHAEAAPEPPQNALPQNGWVLLALCVAELALLCLHKTMGGWQWGNRYTVDCLIFPLVWALGRRPDWQPGLPGWTLLGMSALWNLYGAVYMLSA